MRLNWRKRGGGKTTHFRSSQADYRAFRSIRVRNHLFFLMAKKREGGINGKLPIDRVMDCVWYWLLAETTTRRAASSTGVSKSTVL